MTARPTLVAAHDDARGIGRAGDIPWRVPADFAHFRRLTLGHVLVIGRATLMSLPGSGLPGRRIVCVTASPGLPGADACRPNLEAALETASAMAGEARVFIAGGAGLYADGAPLAGDAWVTRIPGLHGCDRFFPDLEALGWSRVARADLDGAVAERWIAPPASA